MVTLIEGGFSEICRCYGNSPSYTAQYVLIKYVPKKLLVELSS